MKAAIITPGRDVSKVLAYLEEIDPDFKPEVWPDIKDPNEISAALVWNISEEIIKDFKNLRLMCSFGAGVDHLIMAGGIPTSTRITRLVDPNLSNSVSNYCLMAIISYQKNFREHILNQQIEKWGWKEDQSVKAIGILGMGEIGRTLAQKLSYLGYKVNGYSLSKKDIDKIEHFTGASQLDDFLQVSDIIINLMPLTPDTTGYFNKSFFQKCKEGTYLINVGRGKHVVEEDLLAAIDQGQIAGATLDVFDQEPLPKHHPYWKSSEIVLTPHIAGLTAPKSAAIQFYDNYQRLISGDPLINEVDRSRGY